MAADPRSAGRLHTLYDPVRVEVRVGPAGDPVRVAVPRRQPRKVEVVQERWRIDEGWWWATPVARLYWRLVLDNGQLVTVFQDQEDGSWWEQRA
jgi:hypothetical protein